MALCLVFPLFGYAQVSGVVVRADVEDGFLAARAGPSTDSDIIYQFQPGDFLLLDPDAVGWHEVKIVSADGTEQTVYVYSSPKYLQPAAGGTIRIKPRTAPSTGQIIPTTVYKNYGCDWSNEDCRGTGVGWLFSDAKARVIDSKIVWVKNPITGEFEYHQYNKVRFSYSANKNCAAQSVLSSSAPVPACEGWVDADAIDVTGKPAHVTPTPPKPAPPPKPPTPPRPPEQIPPKPCPPPSKGEKPHTGIMDDILYRQRLQDAVKLMRSKVGSCFLDPADGGKLRALPPVKGRFPALEFLDPNIAGNGTVFDNEVIPYWQAQKNLPTVYGSDLKPITKAEWVAVDAVARSVYAEMAQCHQKDPLYLDAVVKVASNRSEDCLSGDKQACRDFMRSDSKELHFDPNDPNKNLKHPLTRVFTKPGQFAVWDKTRTECQKDSKGKLVRDENKKPICSEVINPALDHLLCPPSEHNPVLWSGYQPGPNELAIWDYAMNLAVKAVLFEPNFRDEMSGVTAQFYTSSQLPMGKRKKLTDQHAGDFTFPASKCIQFY